MSAHYKPILFGFNPLFFTTALRKIEWQFIPKEKRKEMADSDIAVYGLAVMGQNFALNIASHGFHVSVSNRSSEKVDTTTARAKAEGISTLRGFKDPREFVLSLKRPRKIVILVQAGKAVDETIALLSEHMDAGDILVDAGNEWFPNSVRRSEELLLKGIYFFGMGISGGEEGARKGPSLMPGGPAEAYVTLEPILSKCAAQVADGPCVTRLGVVGTGNYVKMVHNGIEYADMQLIAEIYHILKFAGGLTNSDLERTFVTWNQGELESYLIEITASILGKKDDLVDDETFVLDKILDKAGAKGTGRWTVQEAAERNVALPTVAAAVDSRNISARRDERILASSLLNGPSEFPQVDPAQIIEDCRLALYAAKIASYAQGFSLIQDCSEQMGWNINVSECARIWQGGCIIRAAFLKRICVAFSANPELSNLMIDPDFSVELNRRQQAWRRFFSLNFSSLLPFNAF